jgi:hypothetical protein
MDVSRGPPGARAGDSCFAFNSIGGADMLDFPERARGSLSDAKRQRRVVTRKFNRSTRCFVAALNRSLVPRGPRCAPSPVLLTPV